MGLDDPKLLLGHVSFDGQVHAIWVLYFKGEQVAIVIQNTLINSCWGCNIWSDPKSYNRYSVHFCIPWILEVDSNDPCAGTTYDYFCCFCQLCLCRYTLHMQVRILTRSCGLFDPAITSVDGCCLYIIIHNSTLHRTWL